MPFGSIIGALLGAAIGFFAGPVGAAAWGWMIGGVIGGMLDGPEGQGPRLSDLHPPGSEYGRAIPIVYGTTAVSANVIWQTDLEEEEHTEGDSLFSDGVTTYKYYANFAILLCESNGDVELGRMWAGQDRRLIWDGTTLEGGSITYYNGADGQLPDSFMESFEGAGNVPSYQGYAIVVFNHFPVEKDFNSIPLIIAEVGRIGDSPTDTGTTSFVRVLLSPTRLYYIYKGTQPGAFLVRNLVSNEVEGHVLTDGLSWPVDHNAYSIADAEFTMLTGADSLGFSVVDFNTNLRTFYTLVPPVGADSDLGTFIFGHGYVNGKYIFATYGATAGRVGLWTVDPSDPSVVETAYASDTGAGTVPTMLRVPTDGENSVFVVSPNKLTKHPLGPSPVVVDLGVVSSPSQCEVDPYTGNIWTVGITGVNGIVTVTAHDPDTGLINTHTGETFYSLAQNCIAFWPGTVLISGEQYYAIDRYWQFDDAGYNSGVIVPGTYRGTAEVHAIVYNPYVEYTGPTPVPIPALWNIRTGGLVTTNEVRWFWVIDGWNIAFAALDIEYTAYLKENSYEAEPDYFNIAESTVVAQSQGLDEVVADLCVRAGLDPSEFDVTDLANDLVDGYQLPAQTTVRGAIQALQPFFYFDGVESQGVLKWVKRGGALAVTIPDEDLGAYNVLDEMDNDLLITKRAMENELPAAMSVQYINRNLDYQPMTKQARRIVGDSLDEQTIDSLIVATDTKGQEVAEVNLHRAWVGRKSYSFNLPLKYVYLEPTDLIEVRGYTMLLTGVTESNGVLKCESVFDDYHYDPHVVVTETPTRGQIIAVPSATIVELIDASMVSDSDNDPGFYMAAHGVSATWTGATLYGSSTGEVYTALRTISSAATMGVTTDVLGDFWTGNIPDEVNSVNVQLANGTLASTNAAGLLAGTNACIIGNAQRYEVLFFRDATLEVDGTYTLTGLLRGRRGTEYAMSLHEVGDTFVFVNGSLARVPQTITEIGVQRYYKAVSNGSTLLATTEFTFTNEGTRLRPYAPVQLGGGLDAAGDLLLRATRRNRISGEWANSVDVPMSEATEAYEFEIWDGPAFGNLMRTLDRVSTASATYSLANQTADFGTPQSVVYFKVYQISATVGRGHAALGDTAGGIYASQYTGTDSSGIDYTPTWPWWHSDTNTPQAGIAYPLASYVDEYVAGIYPTILSQNPYCPTAYASFTYNYQGWVMANLKGEFGGNTSVSEGAILDGARKIYAQKQAYGMLLTVLREEPEYNIGQARFDSMFAFARQCPATASPYLMEWRMMAGSGVPDPISDGGGDNCLSADLDIALALLMADRQWGSAGDVNYLAEALLVITAIKTHCMHASGYTQGLAVGTNSCPSDWKVGHFRAFLAATSDTFWDDAIDMAFSLFDTLQDNYAPTTGFLPEYVVDVTTTPAPSSGGVGDERMIVGGSQSFPVTGTEGDFWANSANIFVWLAADYLTSGDVRSKDVVNKLVTYINGQVDYATDIAYGYELDGTPLNDDSQNSSGSWIETFIDATVCGAMVDTTHQTFLNGLTRWKAIQDSNIYSQDEIPMLALLVISGNWWKP
jgi:hypothetical protein